MPNGLIECEASWLQSLDLNTSGLIYEGGNGYLRANDGTRLALVDYEGGSILPCRFCCFGTSYPEGEIIDIPEGVTHVDFQASGYVEYGGITLADTVIHYCPTKGRAGNTSSHRNQNYAFFAAGDYDQNPIPEDAELLVSRTAIGHSADNPSDILPTSLRCIGTGAFNNCLQPNQPIDIPASVSRIEIAAFAYSERARPFALRIHGGMSGFADDWCPFGMPLILA